MAHIRSQLFDLHKLKKFKKTPNLTLIRKLHVNATELHARSWTVLTECKKHFLCLKLQY